jgi:hypothetical protein
VQVSETAGAKSGAVDRVNARIDPELAQVIDAWPTLPPAIHEAISDKPHVSRTTGKPTTTRYR